VTRNEQTAAALVPDLVASRARDHTDLDLGHGRSVSRWVRGLRNRTRATRAAGWWRAAGHDNEVILVRLGRAQRLAVGARLFTHTTGTRPPMVEGKDHGAMASGDEAPLGERSAGEDMCEACSGSGRVDGERCEECGGTGRIERAVGGG
jgi:hypothetical protein